MTAGELRHFFSCCPLLGEKKNILACCSALFSLSLRSNPWSPFPAFTFPSYAKLLFFLFVPFLSHAFSVPSAELRGWPETGKPAACVPRAPSLSYPSVFVSLHRFPLVGVFCFGFQIPQQSATLSGVLSVHAFIWCKFTQVGGKRLENNIVYGSQ